MASWGAWLAIIGGVVAVVGQFIGTSSDAWLPLIGGVVAVIGGIGALASK